MDHYDLKNFEFIKTFIEPGDVLVDVGANFGDYTNFFLSVLGNTGKIYSFELVPETANVLKNTFVNCENVKVFNNAVTNKNSKITYFKGTDAWTNNIIGHNMDAKKTPSTLGGEIDGVRLDEILADEIEIKLIKIDVEGAEKFVLEGMENIIRKVKYILLECHLKEEWDYIKNILLNKFNLTCIDLDNMKKINKDSDQPYQCFCINKNIL